MGKALVIKNVTFAENKLDTVEFVDSIPCLAIELNKETTTMSAVGATETLVATVTPENTTDTVVWSSSDPTVVSVSGGVLTQTGVGTATITATCGMQTATCEVSTVNTLSFMCWIGRENYKASSSQDYVLNIGASGDSANHYASIQSTSETTKNIWVYNYTGEDPKYPILLGNGANHIEITCPNTIRPLVWFTDSETACDYSIDHETFANRAKVISGDRNAYDALVPLGNRSLDVPEGADSVAMGLHCPTTDITDADVALVTVVASKVVV